MQMLKRTLVLLAAAMVALTMSATAAFAAIPAHPKFKSSAKEATWHNSNFMFQNDMWSCPQAACGSQTIWANGPNNWGAEANMAKQLAAEASWEAADMCVQTHGGFGFAEEFDIERKFRETRLYTVAPISTNMILNFISEHVLDLPRSY